MNEKLKAKIIPLAVIAVLLLAIITTVVLGNIKAKNIKLTSGVALVNETEKAKVTTVAEDVSKTVVVEKSSEVTPTTVAEVKPEVVEKEVAKQEAIKPELVTPASKPITTSKPTTVVTPKPIPAPVVIPKPSAPVSSYSIFKSNVSAALVGEKTHFLIDYDGASTDAAKAISELGYSNKLASLRISYWEGGIIYDVEYK